MQTGSSQTQLTWSGVCDVAGVGNELPTLQSLLTRHGTCRVGLPELTGERPPDDRNPALLYLGSLPSGESRRTQASALRSVALLFGYELASCPWHELRAPHTRALRALLAERYAPQTASRYLTATRETVRWAGRLGLAGAAEVEAAAELPGVKGSRLPKGRAQKASEVRALFEAARADKRRRRGARDSALVALLWGAGLRRAEVARVNREWYDGRTIRVVGKGNREREIPLPEGARRALDAWVELRGSGPGPLICSFKPWGRRLSPEAVADALARLARRARVAAVTTHDGRRTFITRLFEAGAEIGAIQDLAGHASPAQTAKYRRDRAEAKERAVQLLQVPYV